MFQNLHWVTQSAIVVGCVICFIYWLKFLKEISK